MTPVIPNWPVVIIVLIGLLFLGLLAIIFPITVMKFIMRWPKFIFPKISPENDLPQPLRDAVYLLDNSPEEYARRFGRTLWSMRIGGCFALFVFLGGLILAILAFIER